MWACGPDHVRRVRLSSYLWTGPSPVRAVPKGSLRGWSQSPRGIMSLRLGLSKRETRAHPACVFG